MNDMRKEESIYKAKKKVRKKLYVGELTLTKQSWKCNLNKEGARLGTLEM